MVKRVLQCPIGNMDIGGIENMLMQIYRNIDKEKIQFDFVIHNYSENAYEEEIYSLGGKIYRIPYISRKPLKHIKEFDKLLKEHSEYEIIHIHTTYAIMFTDALIAKKNGRKVIVHSHNSSATKSHVIVHFLFRNTISKLADYRYACSYISGEWMFGKRNQFNIWKNALVLRGFKFSSCVRKKIREELCIADDELLLGNVARLSYQKNQELLLYIFKEYSKQNLKSKLVLVGDGEDRSKLELLSKKYKIENKVIFAGNVSNVNEYLMGIDIFCLTSRWEGFGISMLEALSTGATVVASNVIDQRLFGDFDNVNVIQKPLVINEWLKCIDNIKLLSEKQRMECYDDVCNKGYEITKQINDIEDLYLSV